MFVKNTGLMPSHIAKNINIGLKLIQLIYVLQEYRLNIDNDILINSTFCITSIGLALKPCSASPSGNHLFDLATCLHDHRFHRSTLCCLQPIIFMTLFCYIIHHSMQSDKQGIFWAVLGNENPRVFKTMYESLFLCSTKMTAGSYPKS